MNERLDHKEDVYIPFNRHNPLATENKTSVDFYQGVGLQMMSCFSPVALFLFRKERKGQWQLYLIITMPQLEPKSCAFWLKHSVQCRNEHLFGLTK